MKILNFIENNLGTIIGFIFLIFAIVLIFINKELWGMICFLSAIVTWQQKEIQDLKKYVYDKKAIK